MTGPRGSDSPESGGGLGAKVQHPELLRPEWTEVPGRPHWWQDAKGRFKYAPPVAPPPIVTIY